MSLPKMTEGTTSTETTQPTKTAVSPKRHTISQIRRWDMRKLLLENMIKGLPLGSVADALAKEFDMKADAVRKDWVRRDHWLPTLLKLDKPEEMLKDLLGEMALARQEAWDIMKRAKANNNDNAAVGALRHIHDGARAQIEVLQSLGKITQAPVTITGKLEVETNLGTILRDYDAILEAAAKRNLQAHSAPEQVDSSESPPSTT